MSKASGSEAGATKGGKRKLLLLAIPVVLVAIGAGLWFSGILPKLLGKGGEAQHAAAEGAPAAPLARVFFDMPEIVANMNTTGRRAAYIRLRSKLELSKPEDVAAVQAAMPRLMDLYATYLREMRPEELRGSAGTQRLREELIARASLAAAPARVTDVLFTEILLQ
jgi:flagellar FliL protein